MGEISQLTLYLSKESPISSLLADTLNPIKYSQAVSIHFAYPLPLITYRNRLQLRTFVYMLEERNRQQKNHQKVKTQYNKRAHTNIRKGKPRAPTQGDQGDHTTEPHRIPTREIHPTKTASKVKHQDVWKKAKRVT